MTIKSATCLAESEPSASLATGAAGVRGQSSSARRQTKAPPMVKKAYVRFDDYLDLNEENMRRSCKKIMNKLYCEPGATVVGEPQAAPVAPANQSGPARLRQQSSPPPPPPPPLKGHRVASGGQPAGESASSNQADKSYLRSQYERRQRRQLELTDQMQQAGQKQTQSAPPTAAGHPAELRDDSQMVMNFNLIRGNDVEKFNQEDNGLSAAIGASPGANDESADKQQQQQQQQRRRQRQQDLVARSHELSKRRFFERLERRESIKKNLLLVQVDSANTQQQWQHQHEAEPSKRAICEHSNTQVAVKQTAAANEQRTRQTVGEPVEHWERIGMPAPSGSCRASRSDSGSGEAQLLSKRRAELSSWPPDATHGGLTRPASSSMSLLPSDNNFSIGGAARERNTGGLLIGFHTRRLSCSAWPASSTWDNNGAGHQHLGIEPTSQRPLVESCRELAHSSDSSPFEIKVPSLAHLGLLQRQQAPNRPTLIVKHLDTRHQSDDKTTREPRQQGSGGGSDDGEIERPSTTGCCHKGAIMMATRVLDERTPPHKGDAATEGTAASTATSNNNDASCSSGETIELQSSDNQPKTKLDQQQEATPALREKVISAPISAGQVNQGEYHGAAGDAIEGASSALARTTSKGQEAAEAAQEEDGGTLLEPVGGFVVVVAHAEADHHERPEIADGPTQWANGGDKNNEQHGGQFNEPIGGRELEPHGWPEGGQTKERQVRVHLVVERIDELESAVRRDPPAAVRDVPPVAEEEKEEVVAANMPPLGQIESAAANQLPPCENSPQQSEPKEHSPLTQADYANGSRRRRRTQVEPSGRGGADSHERITTAPLTGAAAGQLIEPLYCEPMRVGQRAYLSRGRRDEDIRSSCSSSGFGASMSGATSSSSSTSPHLMELHQRHSSPSFGASLHQTATDQLYDLVRPGAGKPSQSGEGLHQQPPPLPPLVGPDQAYPVRKTTVGQPLLIENHGYASLAARCQVASGPAAAMSHTMEFYSSPTDAHYANLPVQQQQRQHPRQKQASSGAEYASVRGAAAYGGIPPTANKAHSKPASLFAATSSGFNVSNDGAECDSSLSGHNEQTARPASANSGGFSKLPPVRIIDHNFANITPDPCSGAASLLVGMESQLATGASGQAKSVKAAPAASLLRRFGSLFSRAFTSQAANCQQASSIASHTSPDCWLPSVESRQEAPVALAAPLCPSPAADSGPPESGRLSMARVSGGSSQLQLAEGSRVGQSLARSVLSCSSRQRNEPAQADLVILPAKNGPNQQEKHQSSRGAAATAAQSKRHSTAVMGQIKSSRDRSMPPARRAANRRRLSRTISINSTASSSSCSSSVSAAADECVSLIAPATTAPNYHHTTGSLNRVVRKRRHLERASSLSDELESLMSPAEMARGRRRREASERGVQQINEAAVARSRISIDCVSPIERKRQEECRPRRLPVGSGTDATSTANSAGEKSRSLFRWFDGASASNGSLVVGAPRAATKPAPASSTNCALDEPDGATGHGEQSQQQQHEQRWAPSGFVSLMDESHVSGRRRQLVNSGSRVAKSEQQQSVSLIYAKVKQRNKAPPPEESEPPEEDHHHQQQQQQQAADKCQSLGIYQSLLHNYVKKHRHRHHCRRHHHHHGHSHHQHGHSNNRHGQGHRSKADSSRHRQQTCCSASGASTRRAHSQWTKCGDCSSCSSTNLATEPATPATKAKSFDDKSSVWGQLIKICKSDGSQVIELERAAGKPWGFFVARGAINNVKGIFISRMHDSVTSGTLAGLLGIGDRILSIDNCLLGPDFDILRVNQMISKKSKIQLRVRPFRG